MSCIIDSINQIGDLILDFNNIDLELLGQVDNFNNFVQVDKSSNDTKIIGSESQSNALLGQCGNDRLIGGEAADYLSGGHGNDRIIAGGGNDYVTIEGNDKIELGAGCDTLSLEFFEGAKKAFVKDFDFDHDKLLIRKLKTGENAYIQNGELFLGTEGTNIKFYGLTESEGNDQERFFLEEGVNYEVF
jgi:Ca2+-binding RTX toxin-like protein